MMMASTATQATYCGVMSILWVFQASHKLGPSRSITCHEKGMSGTSHLRDVAKKHIAPQVNGLCLDYGRCLHVNWPFTMM